MKQLRKLLVLLAILSAQNSMACSFSIGREGYRIGLFLPYTYYKPWLGMLQYDLNTSYDPDISLAIEHDRTLNCSEWKNYCGKTVELKDIYFVLYEMPPVYFLEAIEKPLDPTKTEAGNTFIRWLLKHKPALGYMRFAKYCESVSIQEMDPWDEDMVEFNSELKGYYDKGYREWENSHDFFLEQRWALQFNRIHVYMGASEVKMGEAMGMVQKEPQSSQLIRGWNCAYISKLGEKDDADRNILLARAFDLTQDKKYFAIRYFSSSALSTTIDRIYNDPHLRAVAYGLAALNKQDECMDLIRHVMEEEANSEVFELVVTREIEKIEDRLMTEKITGFYPAGASEYWADDANDEEELIDASAEQKSRILENISRNGMNRIYFRSYAQILLNMIESLLEQKKLDNKAFFHLAAAHLCWCLQNIPGMDGHIKSAGKQIDSKNPLYVNLCVEKTLLHCLQQKGLNDAAENLAFEVLSYTEKVKGYDVQNFSDQFCTVLSAHYEDSGDLYKSVLIMPEMKGLYRTMTADAYGFWDYTNSPHRYFAGKATVEDADEMSTFLERKNHNLLEKLMVRDFARDSASYDMLMEWVGSVYLRNEKWEQALQAFEKVDPRYWNLDFGDNYTCTIPKYKSIDKWFYYPIYFDANPFYARVNNNHSPSAADTVHYSKLSFTKKWLQLDKQKSSSDPKKRDVALLHMANARYNMTWYGNSWVLWRNEWSAYENKYWPGFEKDYFGCDRAREAYKKLYDLTSDREIKANCCVMLAVCERNKAYYLHRSDDQFKYKGNHYLKSFMNHFNGTRTYENLMSSCMGEEYFVYTMKHDARERW